MSVSYAVDFAALHPARPARDDDRRGRERVEPVHVPDEDPEPARTARSSAWRAWRSPCRSPGFAYLVLGGVPGALGHDRRGQSRGRWSARRLTYFVFNTLLIAVAIGLATHQSILPVWNQNFLWSAPSYFVGAGVRARRRVGVSSGSGIWMALLPSRAAVSHLSHLQDLHRAHRRRAAARAGDGRSAPGDDRGAGAGDRRQGSDRAVAHPPRAGVRRRPGQGARACRTARFRASRPRRCCTTSASSPCPSTSCRSPAR